MAEQPKFLTPEQKAIVDAFEETNAAIQSVVRCFGRLAFVVDQQMLKTAGITPPSRGPGLKVVKADDDAPEPSPEDIIAAAEKALGVPKETVY